MAEGMKLVNPGYAPPLDEEFRPAVLANRAFEQETTTAGEPLIFGLERGADKLARFEVRIFPDGHPRMPANFYYAERILKFLLWQIGGHTVYVGGSRKIGEYLQRCYSPGGMRDFDTGFMSEQVFERPFSIVPCHYSQVPPAQGSGEVLGRHLDGCRVGFDLGASDRKVCAVIDGKVVYSEEIVWDPRAQNDPDYHYREIITAIKTAASKMPRLDAIGGSSAGIYIDNRPMVASIFRGIPPDRFHEIHDLFQRIRAELNVPLVVINDGDVTALAGSMALGENGILGIAMGSSQAAGYIDMNGIIKGWLNELAFAPIDYNPTAPVDEWSGDIGCGAQYFSQQCVFRLARVAGITIPANLPDAEKLVSVQDKLETGHPGAVKIWQSIGIYLGYALAHYAAFYDTRHVLVLGRCTSGLGGSLIIDEANKVLKGEFPDLARRIHVQLPDERSRRVGQSIAAASLPKIEGRQ